MPYRANRLFVGLWVLLAASCTTPQNTDGGRDAATDVTVAMDAMDTPPPDRIDPVDAGDVVVADDGVAICATDMDCADTTFCNGAERCMPGAPGADARGCLAANPATPCLASQMCDEVMRRCLSECDRSSDADGDGHRSTMCGGDDCDDSDVNRFPGNPEVCDALGHDEDCDAATLGRDRDGDGFVPDTCCNRLPSGMLSCGTDCDDMSMDVNPTAPEICDNIDDNCDGRVDEGVRATFYRDVDGDGFGQNAMTVDRCSAPPGYVLTGGDCDDTRIGTHPGQTETCNMIDDDCDGRIDPDCMCSDGLERTCGESDGMGGFLMVGACHAGTETCTLGQWGSCTGDVRPTSESCNGVDDDCDGSVDEGVTNTYFRDADGDGYGDTAMTMQSCGAPTGFVPLPGDCDDTRASVRPTGSEMCNGMDDDCDGLVDEGVLVTYYRDADSDTYGTATITLTGCSLPAGYATRAGDCDDAATAVHPGVADGCDTIDNDCDGTPDPGCTCTNGTTQMCGTTDGMGGFLNRGICHPGMQTCSSGAWSACSGNVNPVTESCNSLDDDCDGVVDNGATQNWYRDCDRDGYGAQGSTPVPGCSAPSTPPSCGGVTGAWVNNSGDCNDAVATTFTGAPEQCNNVDDDCDGAVDGAPAVTWCNDPSRAAPNMVGSCGTGATACTYACAAGWLNCNATTPGCETDGNSPMTCGGCTTQCHVPTCTSGVCVNDATAIAVGGAHACAVLISGSVVCWGSNSSGQLGDGTTTNRSLPTPVVGLTDATAIAAGNSHTCARRNGGSIVCWGNNSSGQLGDGTTTRRLTPTPVMGLPSSTFRSLVLGGYHSCVRYSASLRCWGRNSSGQLGDGTTVNRPLPVTPTTGISSTSSLTAGLQHTCAADTTGRVACWGSNSNGQLGNGTTTNASTGVVVAGVTSTSVRSGPTADYTCTLTHCWGAGTSGQLGNQVAADSLTPSPVIVPSGYSTMNPVGLGSNFACAQAQSSTNLYVLCYGDNTTGQLGDSYTVSRLTPARTASGTRNAWTLEAGTAFICAYFSGSHSVLCWGSNTQGQVGNGTMTSPVVAPSLVDGL